MSSRLSCSFLYTALSCSVEDSFDSSCLNEVVKEQADHFHEDWFKGRVTFGYTIFDLFFWENLLMLVKQVSQLRGLSAHAKPLVQRKVFAFASYLSTEAIDFCMHCSKMRSPQHVLITNCTAEITFVSNLHFRRNISYFPQI